MQNRIGIAHTQNVLWGGLDNAWEALQVWKEETNPRPKSISECRGNVFPKVMILAYQKARNVRNGMNKNSCPDNNPLKFQLWKKNYDDLMIMLSVSIKSQLLTPFFH